MRTILFVEDDEKIRDLFSRLLKLRGYQIAEAKDGQQAVALAKERRFDLVCMDLKMPKLDGLSAFEQIRAVAPDTKVVLTTGFSVTDALHQALQQGVVEYLRKPFTIDQLTSLIDRLLAPHDEGDAETARPS